MILALFMIHGQSCSYNLAVAPLCSLNCLFVMCYKWICMTNKIYHLMKMIKCSAIKAKRLRYVAVEICYTARGLWPRDNVTIPQSEKWQQYKPHWFLDYACVCSHGRPKRHNCGLRYGKTDEVDYRVLHSYQNMNGPFCSTRKKALTVSSIDGTVTMICLNKVP